MTTISRKDVKQALKDGPSGGKKKITKEQRRAHAVVKKKAIELEHKNKDAVIIFPAVDPPWYRAGNLSALIYIFDLAPRMGRKSKILIDDDKAVESFKWSAAIHDKETFIAGMKKIGYEKYEDLGDGIYRFPLGKTLTRKQIDDYYAQVRQIQDELLALAKVEKSFPKFYGQLIQTLPIVFSKVKRMSPQVREMVGNRLWENMMRVNELYFRIARGKVKSKPGFEKMIEIIEVILDEMVLISDVSIWDPMTAAKMTKIAAELREAAIKEAKWIVKNGVA